MTINSEAGVVIIEKCFDLAQTLDCGQSFRWKKKETDNDVCAWHGIACGKYLEVQQTEKNLQFLCTRDDFNSIWQKYFDLNTDYNEIRETLSNESKVLKEAAQFAPGIRILRQEPWEALASFLISQNNNIPRIKGIIERFAELCGEKIENGYAFPQVEVVANMTVEDLAPIRAGFRAKYIIAAAKAVTSGEVDFKKIEENDIEFGREELQKICGVGPKVAECVLLYGFHKTEAFPIDVWMKRAMETLFPNKSPEDFGKNAGLAQQYIFHYSRMHPEIFK